MIAADSSEIPVTKRLYLHCIGLNPNGDPSLIRLLTLRVRSGEVIEFAADKPSLVSRLTGRIEVRDSKFFAHLNAKISISSGEFSGEVKPDERFAPEWVGGSGIYMFAFVLSHYDDPAPFLKEPLFKPSEHGGAKPKS